MDFSTGIFFGILSMLCWGCSDFFVAESARKTDPLRAFLWSQLIAIAIMIPLFIGFFKLPAFTPGIVGLLLLTGMFTVIANWAFYKSLRVGKVAIVMPVGSCWAVVTVVLSILLLGDVLTLLQAIGAFFAIAGAVLVSFRWDDLITLKGYSKGVNYAALCALSYGIDFVIIDLLVDEIGWFLPIFFIGIITEIYLISYSGITKKGIGFPKNAAIFIALVGILDTVAYLAYGLGVSLEYGSIVAPIGAASPVISVLLASVFFHEKTHTNQKVGVVSAIAGLVLLSI